MNRCTPTALLLAALLPLSGCLKDELDVDTLRGNPFDPAYDGPTVFELESTYTQQIDTGEGVGLVQVITFRVRRELLPSGVNYSVKARDLNSGQSWLLNPDPPGTDRFRVLREPLFGSPVCLALALSNNFSEARTDTLCATL